MNNAVPPFAGNINFNAQHSPMGAYASFTCGHFGTRGGIAAESGAPAKQDWYIGVKQGSRSDHAPLHCLPFFQSAQRGGAGAGDFLVEQAGPPEQNVPPKVLTYRASEIRRHYGWATDQWATDDFTFTVFSPFGEIPDPIEAEPLRMRNGLLPAVMAELTVDNTRGKRTKTAFVAVAFNEPGWLPIPAAGDGRRGFSLRGKIGLLGQIVDLANDTELETQSPELFCRWSPDQGLDDPLPHLLGTCPGLLVEVLPGQCRTLRFAIGCYLGDVVTTGREGRYLYTRYFSGLEDVLAAALDRGNPHPACAQIDRQLLDSGLSADQQFLIAHATRSYYGNTQLLDIGGKPFWLVNEGEYCMMNTLDLSVDQMFWELKHNSWVVRNLLDNFVRYYSYVDNLKAEGGRILPGGISFTHDMGVHNNFSAQGQSSYELPELNAICFSYMTAEQLCNWVLIATTYVNQSGDLNWARQNSHVLLACLDSLCNRGGKSGIPEFDSTRCGANGAEITTYDSLDHSLAQTRNNLYMGVKFWASFRGLALIFDQLGDSLLESRDRAVATSELAAQTLVHQAKPDGVIPAVFEIDNAGFGSRILPACEGLLYPYVWGEDVSSQSPAFFEAMRRHARALLTDPEKRNLFPDGGIRLSSTSNNSWMSKIAIFQHVARHVFHLDTDPRVADLLERSDAAHVKWQTDGSAFWACCDQIVSGVAKGSRYYPRVITTGLWLDKNRVSAERGQTQGVLNPHA